MPLLGKFQDAVLSKVDELGEAAYGMKIRDSLQKDEGKEIHMPQVYAALSRLESLGLVDSSLDQKNSAGRRGRTRRVYFLNARGLQYLRGGCALQISASTDKEKRFDDNEAEEAVTA